MAIVSGHFTTLIHPGLRQVWAGVYFQQKGKLFVPSQFGQWDVNYGKPDSRDFKDRDDYEAACWEWMFDRGF